MSSRAFNGFAAAILMTAVIAGMLVGAMTGGGGGSTAVSNGATSGLSTLTAPSPTQGQSAGGLTAQVAPQQITVADQVVISGALAPPRSGVVIQVQVQEGGEWRDFPATAVQTKADGTFSVRVKPGRPGQFAFRVAGQDAASSELTVTVV